MKRTDKGTHGHCTDPRKQYRAGGLEKPRTERGKKNTS